MLAALNEIATNYAAGRWEPAELNGGKLCEAAYTILRGHVDGAFAATPQKPRNMVDACRDFEKAAGFPQSVRITTPRVLMALYEIRNNRGVGHAGNDVDANHMDATLVLAGSKWVVAELIRLLHNVDTRVATALVDTLVDRMLPSVWTVGGMKRVLTTGLSMKEQTLLLLYNTSGPVAENDLVAWVEHSNASAYRRDVLMPAHKDRLIEYDRPAGFVHLSPKGSAWVETRLLPP